MKDFDFSSIAHDFDYHISHSIRGYDELVEDVLNLSSFCIEEGTNVVDIGSSTGALLTKLAEHNKRLVGVSYVGIEPEVSFKPYYKDRPDKHYMGSAADYFYVNTSFVCSLFTLQFMNCVDRAKTISAVYEGLNVGGVFLLTEKVDIESSCFNEQLQALGIEYKTKFFSPADILDKEISLRYMMRKKSPSYIKKELEVVGFKDIVQFWQNHRFVGFICRK